MPVDTDLTLRASDGTAYTEPLASLRFYLERDCRIILIHGFRNSEAAALESYDLFKSYFSIYPSILANKLFFLVWPGDQSGLIRYFDNNVQTALESGRALGRFLNRLIATENSDCQFVIIGHSLGCRLAAAMMSELYRLNAPACPRFKLFLMAGAVPKHDIQDGNVFGAGLAAASYVANLYSPDDNVLATLFPLGEMGGFRISSEPIGLNGEPADFKWSLREHMKQYGHGDYWRKMSAAQLIARVLGVAVPTALPENEIVAHQSREHTP